MKLKNRVVVVTGASRGIGKAIANAFADEGAIVALNYNKSMDHAIKLLENIRAKGNECCAIKADVSKEIEVEAMVNEVLDKYKKIDVLVNNAGILTQSLLAEMPLSMWDEVIEKNLRSVFLCSRYTVPIMIKNNYGRIINISSQVGQKGGIARTHYSASKAGIIGFTRALAREVGQYNITVNCIAPGPIKTDMTVEAGITEEIQKAKEKELPLLRYGTPEEVAPSAILLASQPDGNLYTGQTLGPNSGDVMF